MRRVVAVLFVLIMLISCSMEKKVARNYPGEGRDVILKEFGEPDKIVALDNGNTRLIYMKETRIRETPIGTGGFTLDQRMSSAFIKEETWRFDVNQKGMVEKASYEKRSR